MSESIPGLPPAPSAATPRDAAIAVPVRRTAGGLEVLWVQRARDLGFAGGFHAFPGGKLDAEDHAAGGDPFRTAAARELHEETGLEVDAAALLPAGRWVTPPSFAQRFDARLFLVEVPPDAPAPVPDGRELVRAEWVQPETALAEWSAGRALLHAPVLHTLSVLQAFGALPPARALEVTAARMAQTPDAVDFVSQRLEYQRGVRAVPLLTETLPPAAHTNAYLLGEAELLLVDPGATDPAERARLSVLLRALASQGRTLRAIVLTHRHHDHVGAAAWLAREQGLPIWCHGLTAQALALSEGDGLHVSRLLEDGEILPLGGAFPMRWRVLHTPGHARGHVCLLDERSRALIAGDMVSGLGTILIDPPEGDMGEYLRQLMRLELLPVGTLYPAHGPPLPDGPVVLRALRAHRAAREEKVLAALGQGFSQLPEVARAAYAELPPEAAPLTERSTRAILLKLMEEGRVLEASGYRLG